jgi:choline dehydrogenase-like flavoprotein
MTVLDLHDATGLEFPDPDVCVIGAGAAGIILATQLLKQGKRVLVLEGGGRDLEPTSQALYESDVAGHPHEGIHHGRYRMYGGTTTKWGGQVLEFGHEDFEVRPWMPGSGWPFGKNLLKPYYTRALAAEGITRAERSDEEVWRRLRLVRPDFGIDLESYFSLWTPDPDFTRLYKTLLEKSDQLMVYLHANAVQLVLHPDPSRVGAVRCRTLKGREMQFRARSFALFWGVIETTRFLLQPGYGYPWEGHPLLGRNFQDHVAAVCGAIVVQDPRRFYNYFSNAWVRGLKYQPKLKLSVRLKEQEMLLGATAVPIFVEDESLLHLKAIARDVVHGRISRVKVGDASIILAHLPTLARHAWEFKRHGRAYHSGHTSIQLNIFCEQEPLGQSAIYLSSERDSLGLLRATLDWHISDLELRTLRRCTQIVQQTLKAQGIATVIPDADLLSITDRFRLKCYDSAHHMGGVRMGRLPDEGIVDPELRIHGIENAYVCSTAVFPTSGSSNPTHTLIALAIRLSDTLVQRLAGAPAIKDVT